MKEFYHPKIELMDREDLEKLQGSRLKDRVKRVYERSKFYRDKFDRAGIKPEDIKSLKDITKLPFTHKDEIRKAQEKYGKFGGLTCADPKDWRELHPSSGTTGRPVGTLWTERDIENITDFTARLMWAQGVRPGDVIQNGFSYGLWVAGLAVHYAAHKLGCFLIPMGATSSDRQIEMFQQWGSDVFFATPSFAMYILEKMKAKGIGPDDIHLRIGSFGGEAGAEVESTRRKLEEGLGIDAYDIYGLAEIGPTMAAECEAKAGLHWTEDHHLVEIVDPETGEPLKEGEEGVLVITHLTREGTPLIRYWTNDKAILIKEKCECGRTHARSPGGILGRADDMVIYKGAKFYPSQVENVVRAFDKAGDEFLIRLEKDARGLDICTVVVELLDKSAKREILEQELKGRLKSALNVTPEVEFVEPGTLKRTEFKAKRVIDNR